MARFDRADREWVLIALLLSNKPRRGAGPRGDEGEQVGAADRPGDLSGGVYCKDREGNDVIYEALRWQKLRNADPNRMLLLVSKFVFPFLPS